MEFKKSKKKKKSSTKTRSIQRRERHFLANEKNSQKKSVDDKLYACSIKWNVSGRICIQFERILENAKNPLNLSDERFTI